MDYIKHYNRLIETRKNRLVEPDGYYEKHHIVMRSMGGTDDSSNLVVLTAREHFLAHWLLWQIHRNRQTAAAFFAMCAWKRTGRHPRMSSRIYEEIRKEFGRKHSEFLTKNKPRIISICKNCKCQIDDTKKRSYCSKSCKHSSLEIREQMKLNHRAHPGTSATILKGWKSINPEKRRERALKIWKKRRENEQKRLSENNVCANSLNDNDHDHSR